MFTFQLGQQNDWKANFGELNTHLNTAKDHAVSWNVLVRNKFNA